MKKRLTALLLTLVMVLSLFPTTALAVGRGTQIGGKETVLSWRANRRSSESGLQVTVTGSGLSGKELSVDVLKDAEAEQYFSAIEAAGNTLVNPMALDIKILNDGAEWQPAGKVQVTITRAGASLSDKVYHFVKLTTADALGDGAEAADAAAAEELTIEELASSTTGETATVDTRHFSVYVIGDEPVHNRVTVNFKNGNETIATMYVKKGDIVNGAVSDVVLNDPGVGDLDDKEVFLGWIRGADGEDSEPTFTETDSGNGLGFDEVRKDIAEKDFATALTADGKVVNYYALVYRAYKVTYLGDDDAVVKSDELLIPAYTEETEYKGADNEGYVVNANYTPDSVHNFEGWKTSDSANFTVQNEAEGVITETDPDDPTKTITVYKNSVAKLFVKGDIVFYVNAPAGHWLVFDENGRGATYCAPQFVKSGDPTVRPRPDTEMLRTGYEFKGWFVTKEAADPETPLDESQMFTFGNALETNTTIYARWEKNDTAGYTVIIYQQNLAGNGYDLKESRIVRGTVGADFAVTANGSNVTVGTENIGYTGFSLRATNPIVKSSDTINAEGDSVVSVYFDRNEYTLTFIDPSATTGRITYVYGGITYSDATIGSEITNNNNIKTLERNKKDISGYEVSYYTTGGIWSTNNYAIKIDGKWYQISNYGSYVYSASSITAASLGVPGGVVKTITAKYQQDISSNFPIVGTNGVTYRGYVWTPQNSQIYTSGDVPSLDIMDAESTTFYAKTYGQGTTIHMYYYTEVAPGQTGTVEYGGKQFVEYQHVEISASDGIVSTEAEDFYPIVGFSKLASDPAYVDGSVSLDRSNNYTIKFYYTRQSFSITFMDGIYVNGNNGRIDDEINLNKIAEKTDIVYGANLAEYDSKTPVQLNSQFKQHNGYVFEGWYADEACNAEYDFTKHTMPSNNVTVYAKWRQIQYRVFLHPNVPESDTTLAWGLTDDGREQAMNFRIDYGKKVSAPTGTRTGYEFGGWFKDEALTVPFSAEYTNLDEQSVTADYDKTVDMTDPMNKYGNGATWNSDAQDEDGNARNRFWITKKLDLYALWRKTVEGADGIGVEYDLNGGDGTAEDTNKYQDATPAIAAAAPTAPQNKQFEYWVVQTWNGTTYVDATDSSGNLITVYPGKSYTVLKDYCKIVVSKWENPENKNDVITVSNPQPGTTAPDSTHTKINEAVYTMRLRAFYKDVETPTPTHITWYANDGRTAPLKEVTTIDGKPLQINQGVNIEGAPSREGYTFLGWARMPEFEKDENGNITNEKVANYTLYEDDLYIKWDAEHSKWLAKDTDGNWTVEATQVAADEADPYQAFYAVWEGYFYVYYTGATKLTVSGSGNTVVRVPITKQNANGYNLTAPIDTSSCLYGGYFKDYTLKSEGFDATKLTYTNNTAKDTNGTAYDGTAYTVNAEGTKKSVWGKPYTQSGLAMTPVAGTVYYVKEVPADKYLQPYFHYTYYIEDNHISTAWLITNVDDYVLNEHGFLFAKESKDGTLVKTLKVKTEHGTNEQTLSSKTKFGVEGYLAYIEVMRNAKLTNGFAKNTNVLQYWQTPDGLFVTGTIIRSYTNVEKHGTGDGCVAAVETPTNSKIAATVEGLFD